ncbi:hypothetical protein ES703_14463 [subsurface metagenome]
MPFFSRISKQRLSSCHPSLCSLFEEVIKYYDCLILVGHRNEKEQNEAYASKHSKLKYPESKHNKIPSLASDVIPWFENEPHIRWHDIKKFYEFGGFVQAIAKTLDIEIRWGGNWDMNDELHDQSFNDLVHFEVKNGN